MVESNTNAKSRRRLGRGLASLMSQPVAITAPATQVPSGSQASPPTRRADQAAPVMQHASGAEEQGGRLRLLDVKQIHPNRYQPRKEIDPVRLEALAASIRQSGVMQPILVRPRAGGGYEIIAGERRWRAAQLAGLKALPSIVCDLDDAGAAEWALVENLQREDLDPIERAEAFQSLVAEFGLTHSQIAERVGLDRSSVANTIRLNGLDDETKADLRSGRLSQGHAKALLSISDTPTRRSLARSAMRQNWSVRRVEREVESLLAAHPGAPSTRAVQTKHEHITTLEERISTALRLPARIRQSNSRTSGQVILTFSSLDAFEAFLAHIER